MEKLGLWRQYVEGSSRSATSAASTSFFNPIALVGAEPLQIQSGPPRESEMRRWQGRWVSGANDLMRAAGDDHARSRSLVHWLRCLQALNPVFPPFSRSPRHSYLLERVI